MLQKSFSVEGGESRKVQFAIPLLSESQEYIVSVCDSSGKICLKANTVVNADTDTTGIYVGVLSDTPAKLGYMADCLGSSEKYGMSDNGVTGKVETPDKYKVISLKNETYFLFPTNFLPVTKSYQIPYGIKNL